MTTTETIFTTGTGIANTRFAMPGLVFDIKLTNAQSNGSIVIAEFEGVPGCEPPRHIHTLEDEIIMITEGEITFFIGDDNIVQAKAGDIVFMPRNVAHHFVITSPYMKATMMATPGNIENYFRSISVPFKGETIPAPQIPTQEEVDHFVKQTTAFGMQFV